MWQKKLTVAPSDTSTKQNIENLQNGNTVRKLLTWNLRKINAKNQLQFITWNAMKRNLSPETQHQEQKEIN